MGTPHGTPRWLRRAAVVAAVTISAIGCGELGTAIAPVEPASQVAPTSSAPQTHAWNGPAEAAGARARLEQRLGRRVGDDAWQRVLRSGALAELARLRDDWRDRVEARKLGAREIAALPAAERLRRLGYSADEERAVTRRYVAARAELLALLGVGSPALAADVGITALPAFGATAAAGGVELAPSTDPCRGAPTARDADAPAPLEDGEEECKRWAFVICAFVCAVEAPSPPFFFLCEYLCLCEFCHNPKLCPAH